VFHSFRRLLDALEGIRGELAFLAGELTRLCDAQKEAGPAKERLEVIEHWRHQFEAECEGLLMKAEGKLRAANNAEARERQVRKSYEHLIDPLAEVGDEPETPARGAVLEDDAETSDKDIVYPLPVDVASDNKAVAKRAKWGVR